MIDVQEFTGRYTVAGPRVYIHPNMTTVLGKDKEILFRNFPAGIFVWVDCNLEDCGVRSHWIDINELVSRYVTSLQDSPGETTADLAADRCDENRYPI